MFTNNMKHPTRRRKILDVMSSEKNLHGLRNCRSYISTKDILQVYVPNDILTKVEHKTTIIDVTDELILTVEKNLGIEIKDEQCDLIYTYVKSMLRVFEKSVTCFDLYSCLGKKRFVSFLYRRELFRILKLNTNYYYLRAIVYDKSGVEIIPESVEEIGTLDLIMTPDVSVGVRFDIRVEHPSKFDTHGDIERATRFIEDFHRRNLNLGTTLHPSRYKVMFDHPYLNVPVGNIVNTVTEILSTNSRMSLQFEGELRHYKRVDNDEVFLSISLELK